jgi:hypothetical protein
MCRSGGTTSPPAVRLTRFAFPATYSPLGFPEKPLFACVLTAAGGEILDVKLLQPIHGGAPDRALVSTIARKWRFDGQEGPFEWRDGDGPGWQRVRINQGSEVESPARLRL